MFVPFKLQHNEILSKLVIDFELLLIKNEYITLYYEICELMNKNTRNKTVSKLNFKLENLAKIHF